MTLSRAEVEMMDEAALRARVLIPLFRRMGFLDVFEYHGGPQEQGKDIVMWRRDEIRDRLNYAIVAKAERITGQAGGRSSAGEVGTQVLQTFGATYQDPRSQEQQRVDRCFVISSHEIKKEATISITNVLRGTRGDGHVDFINGTELWSLIERFMPADGALQKLSEAGEVLGRASEHHRLIATVSDQGTILSIKPKHPGAHEAEPVTFQIKLAYPNTPEGKEALDQFRRFVDSGSPVTIPAPFIAQIQGPRFLEPFMSDKTDGMRLELGPRHGKNALHTNIVVVPAVGDPVRIDGVSLRATQIGETEATFDNREQGIAWRFTLNVDRTAQSAKLTFEFTASTPNVRQELESARFRNALGSGAAIVVEDGASGLPILTFTSPPGSVEGPDDGYIEFLEQVAMIQFRTGAPIQIPERPIPADEIGEILSVAEAIRTGEASWTMPELRVSIDRASLQKTLADPHHPTGQVTLDQNDFTFTVFDSVISMGRSISTFEGLEISASERLAAAQRLESNPGEPMVDLVLTPISGEASGMTRFLKWLPQDEASAALTPISSTVRDTREQK